MPSSSPSAGRRASRRTRRAPTSAARPDFAQALIAAARLDLQRGRTQAAAACLASLLPPEVAPGQVATIAALLAEAGAWAPALLWYDHAAAHAPGDAEPHAGRARALAALGCPADALAAFARASDAGSVDPGLYLLAGNLLREAGHREGAITAYDTALRLRPAFPEALRAGGTLLVELGQPDAALRFLDEALRLAPDDRMALLARTNLLQSLGRFAEALAHYDEALRRSPDQADLLTNRGIALQNLGRLPEARASFEAALAAGPTLAQAWLNSGNALIWFGEPDAALARFDKALALRPDYAEAQCGRGVALKMLQQFDAAAAALDLALASGADLPHARANRGELLLLLGELPGGWADYEDRFRSGRQPRPVLNRPVPLWKGQAASGCLAVLADQGNGDIIHFARYVPLLAQRGFEVTFLCPARLHRLLGAVTGEVRVVDSIPADQPLDWQVALSSLPFALQTSLDDIPTPMRYLAAEAPLVRHWAARIGTEGLRVGLCWRGSQAWQADPRRSLPLAALAPLAAIPGVRLFSLQLPDNTGTDDAAIAALGIDPLGAELDRGADAFVDTAAAIEALDCIVTCDTSIAHLAGALGRPVLVLLQAVPEWRWMLGRDDSPWYASMRLLRQPRPGAGWDEPVATVADVVRVLAASRR